MRVLHVAPSIARAFGGPTQSLIGYAKASLRAGWEVTIGAPESRDERWLRDTLPEVQLRLFPARGRDAFIVSPPLINWLQREVRSHDVVHVHGLFNPVSSFAARTSLDRGVPTVIRPFGTLSRYTFEHRRRLLKRVYYRYVDRRNLTRAAAVHFTTVSERDEASRLDEGFQTRGHVVPPPWVADCAIESGAARRGGQLVLFLSRLHPVKRVEHLLDAWPAVRVRHPTTRLVVAGDGDEQYVRTLHTRVQELGIADSVEFIGFASGERKAKLLASAALFVLPSQHENFGVALLEALAAGIPVVITPEVQLAAFVWEHQLGIVTEATAGPLAAAIIEALHNDELRARCQVTAPGLVARAFSLETIGAALGAMYQAAQHYSPT
jgi:glycosyltransferase involved in cell wall biosynthesis